MSEAIWRPSALMPLLLELTRALRARRFYLPTDPAQSAVLQRSARVWTAAFARAPVLRLDVTEREFGLASGERLSGAGVKDLARALHGAGVHRLAVLPGLQAEEFMRLVELLAGVADAAGPDSALVRALSESELPHLSSGDVEEAPTLVARPTGVPTRILADAKTTDGTIDALVGELERSIRAEDYARIASELEAQLGERMADKDYVDAYRTALALGRHCAGVGPKLPEIQVCASRMLHRLVFGNEELLRIAVQRAYAQATGSAVEAVQLLVALGSDVVPRLLEEHTRGSVEAQTATPGILVVMADAALPVLAEELSATSPARVRRAALLMGEMQHPRAAPLLADVLRSDQDESVLREAARALARIGSRQAVLVLCGALRERRTSSASAAAYGLGWSSDRGALTALCEVVRESGRSSSEVRLQAVASLGRIGGPEAVEALADGLERAGGWNRKRIRAFRLAVVDALGKLEGDRVRSILERHAREGDSTVRDACIKLLQGGP